MKSNAVRILAFIVIPLALVLGACAPNLMGGAAASDVAGSLQATYQASADDVFMAGRQNLTQTPGWTVATADADVRYMRVESSSMRARLFAAPVTITEYVTLSVSIAADGAASVTIQYTEGGATVAQGVISRLNTQFQ